MTWPRTALLSLSDRTGASEFAEVLVRRGTRFLASEGTASHLEESGIPATRVESLTGFGELLGGRVKTLHPNVHAGILARRSVASDMAALAERDLEPIDLVAVSLYPFESRAPSLDDAAALEEIDIGGVALLRAAAKNHADVIVIHAPSQYREVLEALEAGGPTEAERRAWATAAFARTALYDAAIASDLARRATADETGLPSLAVLALERVRALRYGENPHQAAALYARLGEARVLEAWKEGKQLSYNNLLDLAAAVGLVWRFDLPSCVIVKHGQPCGAASARTPAEAYRAALRTDELSAFGGIVAMNRGLDLETASLLDQQFVECLAVPEIARDAEAALAKKKNLRVVRLAASDLAPHDADPSGARAPGVSGVMDLRLLGPWALLQEEKPEPSPAWRVVTRRAPSGDEVEALRFAWEIAAAARSNAIAIARGTALIGIGSGQTSRVDAVDLAVRKAQRAGHDLRGTALASDGFFPFADNVELAAKAGVTSIVQPGGSMRDAEVVEACDARGVAMVFTERRTFRH